LKEGWKGVRPVRFREEIFGVIDRIVSSGEGLSIEEFRNHILKLRLEREDRRLRALQRSVSLENHRRKRPKLLTKVEQMIRVLWKTGMIVKDDEIIRSTTNSRKLISIKQQDEIGADAFFLECLVNSSFRTYWLFLRQLFKRGQISIPSSLSKRDARLRTYIISEGFPLDLWSFFILRDLFYDFSLLNYIIDESFQNIFALYTIEDEIEFSSYKYKIKGPDAHLNFWPLKTPNDFVKELVDVYLSLTDNKWNRMIDLITLRERYSHEYAVPERLFDILIQQVSKQENRYKIVLSVGQIDISRRSTYITKALSLPCNKFGLPYSLIRIGLVITQ